MLAVALGHAIPARELPRRAGDPAVLVAGAERMQRELGWAPTHHDIASIVASAWAWHQTHPNGYAE